MMDGKEKLYFLLERIEDARAIAPSGQPLIIDPTNDLNRKYREIELAQLFIKLEVDEKVLEVLKPPKRLREEDVIDALDPYDHADDGCWHIRLLPAYDSYYLKIQYEPQYQEFTGKKPPAVSRNKLSRKALEKIWGVLQEIEDKRGITSAKDDISIPFVHFSKVKDEIGANNASDERRNVLRKLENEENAIKDVRLPANLREYVYLKIGDRYFETSDYYKNEYKEAAKDYQNEQQSLQALRPINIPAYEKRIVKTASPKEIAKEFSSQNHTFVLMVLEQIALFTEFSIEDQIHYQLQSAPGQALIQERALLHKFEQRGLFRNLGEDGIAGIATLDKIDIDLIKEVIKEIKKDNRYDQLIKEVNKSTLKEQYDKALQDVLPKKQASKLQAKQDVNNNDSFALIDNVLSIMGKAPIEFRKDTRTLRMLKLLVRKPKGIYYGEQTKTLDGAVDDLKDPKNTYYETCRGLENRLAKIGVTDFFEYDYSQAKINPRYKNTSK